MIGSSNRKEAATSARARTAVFVAGVLASLALALGLAFFSIGIEERASATVITDAAGEPIRLILPADGRLRFRVALDEVSPVLRTALIAAEDRRFSDHPGIDLRAIARAAWTNLRAGRVVSGGSTIPMQIARMATPAERTFGAKLGEAIRAILLDARHSKDELLEAYLNLAPFGANFEGVGAASAFWFGKRPGDLSLGEAALLTALPRAPNAYDPVSHPAAARRARDRVLDQLERAGAFSAQDIADARLHPLPKARRRLPFVAPHFAELVAARSHVGERVATTLDRRLQSIAEEQVASRLAGLRASGIDDAAVVVLEVADRAVRAMVGSPDYKGARGQVNGAVARRSPGSTLKPFLYAQAIDEGRIVPDSYVLDIPTDFSGYVAENYDDRYRGRVTAREALVDSLNASSVRLLSDVGLASFHRTLVRGGLATLDRPLASYGLPLILGAGEVTLLDLTNLYATLAAGGLHRAPRMREADHAEEARLFSAEATSLVTGILTEVKRPDLPASWALTRGVPEVAWKTGTSYGHRDAWAVGFSRRYAIGVWVGNFDGRGRKGLSGSEHAGPLLFDLFRAVEGAGARLPEARSANLGTVEVCAVSHDLAGAYCPRATITTIPGKTRLAPCAIHRRVFLDAESGERLAGDCLGRRPYRTDVLTIFPAEVVAWWRAQGESPPALPPLRAECADGAEGEPPRIVSPAAATPYRVRADAPVEFQKLALVARAAPSVTRLWWYQDGELLAAASPAERSFVMLAQGAHRLVVVDDSGRSDSITYRVE